MDKDVILYLSSSSSKSSSRLNSKNYSLKRLVGLVLARIREVNTTTLTEIVEHIAEIQQRDDPFISVKLQSIQRRVYDIINVFLVLSLITQDKRKLIRWLGFPDSTTTSAEEARLLRENEQLLIVIKESKTRLTEIHAETHLFNGLATRNTHIDPQCELLSLPFLTITTPQPQTTITINEDDTEYWIHLPESFEIRNDIEIVRSIHERPEASETDLHSIFACIAD